jgi:two-component system sensor histidine kinase LytS
MIKEFVMLDLFVQLVYRVGFIIMIAFVFSKSSISKNIISDGNLTLNKKITLGIFFAILSIIGTYTGISFDGAIVNTRVIGAAVGGLIGGPITGLIAGSIAGLHRYLIDIGGFTAVSCGISTTVEGLLAGLLSTQFYKAKDKVTFAVAVGIVAEVLQMVIILLIAKPFSEALHLVSIIAFPMIFMNSIGIGIFINIIENIKKVSELEGAFRSYQTFLIADKTLGDLRSNLDQDSAQNIAETIFNATDFDAVSITNDEIILAHIGIGSDFYKVGDRLNENFIKDFITNNSGISINNNIPCKTKDCPFEKSIIVPLLVSEKIIGTLKLYKGEKSLTTQSDIELAKGLGNIFSTQLELSKLDYQKNLRTKAELHALQAQINPHFLFNAINTIVSLTRSDQEKARELLIYLSDYFRHNMNNEKDLIPLEKELDHVKAYYKIEKARFGEKLISNFSNNVKETIYVPPLIIQPIIENSIKHGILKKVGGGIINLNINARSEELLIEIIDNGVGMSEEELRSVNTFGSNTVGLNNVQKRLKTIFHEKASVKIESQLNQGTKVLINLPLVTDFNSIGGYNG